MHRVRRTPALIVVAFFAGCSSNGGAEDLFGSAPSSAGGSGGSGGATADSAAGSGGSQADASAGSGGSPQTGGQGGSSHVASCGMDAPVVEEFSGGRMVGCRGTWSWQSVQSQSGSVCNPGSHLCSAQEWVALRQGKAPSHHYWTADNLREWDGPNCKCSAFPPNSNRSPCSGPGPMHVCAGSQAPQCGTMNCGSVEDPSGNTCCWLACGLDGSTENAFFGGCQPSDNAAGLLCCAD